jgi:hypothetical protein
MSRKYTHKQNATLCCGINIFDRTSLQNSMCCKAANLKFSGACSLNHMIQVNKYVSPSALSDYKDAVVTTNSNPAMVQVVAELREAVGVVAYNAMKAEAERFSAVRLQNAPEAIQASLDALKVARTPEVLSNKRRFQELVVVSSLLDKVTA